MGTVHVQAPGLANKNKHLIPQTTSIYLPNLIYSTPALSACILCLRDSGCDSNSNRNANGMEWRQVGKLTSIRTAPWNAQQGEGAGTDRWNELN